MDEEFNEEINNTADNVHEEPINNEFLHSVDQQKRATGTMIE